MVTHYLQHALAKRQRDGNDSEEEDVQIYGHDGEEGHERDEDGNEAAEVSLEIRSDESLNCEAAKDSDENFYSYGNNHINGGGPWPSEHSNFVESRIAQEQLALEIASGGGASQRPKEMQKGNVRIIIPGSLRERGEFCLVDMSLMEQAVKKNMGTAATAAASTKKKSSFAWRVRRVEFHTMERLP